MQMAMSFQEFSNKFCDPDNLSLFKADLSLSELFLEGVKDTIDQERYHEAFNKTFTAFENDLASVEKEADVIIAETLAFEFDCLDDAEKHSIKNIVEEFSGNFVEKADLVLGEAVSLLNKVVGKEPIDINAINLDATGKATRFIAAHAYAANRVLGVLSPEISDQLTRTIDKGTQVVDAAQQTLQTITSAIRLGSDVNSLADSLISGTAAVVFDNVFGAVSNLIGAVDSFAELWSDDNNPSPMNVMFELLQHIIYQLQCLDSKLDFIFNSLGHSIDVMHQDMLQGFRRLEIHIGQGDQAIQDDIAQFRKEFQHLRNTYIKRIESDVEYLRSVAESKTSVYNKWYNTVFSAETSIKNAGNTGITQAEFDHHIHQLILALQEIKNAYGHERTVTAYRTNSLDDSNISSHFPDRRYWLNRAEEYYTTTASSIIDINLLRSYIAKRRGIALDTISGIFISDPFYCLQCTQLFLNYLLADKKIFTIRRYMQTR